MPNQQKIINKYGALKIIKSYIPSMSFIMTYMCSVVHVRYLLIKRDSVTRFLNSVAEFMDPSWER
jgi:hypothetical protein